MGITNHFIEDQVKQVERQLYVFERHPEIFAREITDTKKLLESYKDLSAMVAILSQQEKRLGEQYDMLRDIYFDKNPE